MRKEVKGMKECSRRKAKIQNIKIDYKNKSRGHCDVCVLCKEKNESNIQQLTAPTADVDAKDLIISHWNAR